jgi:hypothetical protein
MAATENSCFWLADLKKIFSCETAWPKELKHGWKHFWKIRHKDCSYRPDPLTDMDDTGNSYFWLVDFWKSPMISLSQMNQNLVGSIYGRFCIKFPQSRMKLLKDEWHRSAHWASSFNKNLPHVTMNFEYLIEWLVHTMIN